MEGGHRGPAACRGDRAGGEHRRACWRRWPRRASGRAVARGREPWPPSSPPGAASVVAVAPRPPPRRQGSAHWARGRPGTRSTRRRRSPGRGRRTSTPVVEGRAVEGRRIMSRVQVVGGRSQDLGRGIDPRGMHQERQARGGATLQVPPLDGPRQGGPARALGSDNGGFCQRRGSPCSESAGLVRHRSRFDAATSAARRREPISPCVRAFPRTCGYRRGREHNGGAAGSFGGSWHRARCWRGRTSCSPSSDGAHHHHRGAAGRPGRGPRPRAARRRA